MDLELDAPGVTHDLDFKVAITVEDLFRVVGVRAAVEHREGALAEQGVEATLTGVQELVDLGVREVLEAAPGSDAGVDEFGNDDAAFHQGRIAIGASSGVSSQISTISAFDTAMQPSVQSVLS